LPLFRKEGFDLPMKDRYTFFKDAAHGWLEVSIADCRELDLQGMLTGSSYRKGNKLYLEEDWDKNTFINAWEIKKGKIWRSKARERVIFHRTSPVQKYSHDIPEDLQEKTGLWS
jgi:hypothetical protein